MQNPPDSSDPTSRHLFEKRESLPELIDALTAITEEKTYAVYLELESDFILAPAKTGKPFKVHKSNELAFEMRKYQAKPVLDVCRIIQEESKAFLNAPCGTGKTVMSLAIAEQLGAESVVILVDQRKLAEQWEARINEFVPGAAVEQFHSKASKIDSIFQSQARFKVVVAQSLMTRDFTQNPVKCDLLLVDEAHVFSAPRFCQSMYNLDYRASLGLSATPDRKDGLEWVFHRFLGIRQVVVNATTMKATVISPKIKVDLDPDDYQSNWCARDHRMTWYARCTQCEHFAGFPRHCGGNLPDDGHGNVRWAGERFMWTPMLVDLTNDTKYLDQYLPVIKTFFDRGRNVLVFNQFVAPLNYLFEKTKLLLGEEACGVYTSKTKNSDAALEKQLTFVTYKIAQKGLDVPWKDSAILSSPVSDIRQTVGRITRTKEGKQAPLVFDPTITNIPMLRSQATKRRNQYKGLGFKL